MRVSYDSENRIRRQEKIRVPFSPSPRNYDMRNLMPTTERQLRHSAPSPFQGLFLTMLIGICAWIQGCSPRTENELWRMSPKEEERYTMLSIARVAPPHDYRQLLVLPDAKGLLLIGDEGAIFRSTDAGEHWVAVKDTGTKNWLT